MLAIKGHYKNGQVKLLNPIPNVEEAELYIVVVEKPKIIKSSEEEFEEIGLHSFFDTNDDKDVDWEDVFDVKNR
ncbi:MAG: hypothetical protein DRQ49_13065 [Gammaproteobacteria bacterium]|nr:MAG: hypothetical protein DRQ49_13065 [Gammaproteobacteria bacterium]